MPSAITGNVLGPASSSSAGLVTTAAQTFAGKKTLDGGALISGDTSGIAIAAGYVGETSFGTLRSGTGGFSYTTTSSTALTATASSIVSLTLNKGVYLICAKGGGGSSSGGSSRTYSLRIGGTSISNDYNQDLPATSDGSVEIVLPVTITANSTVVALYGTQVVGTSAYNRHEISAVRIA